MIRKMALGFCGLLYLFMLSGTQVGAQEGPNIHVDVNLVQLNVAVTDNHGNYITGLLPNDFAIAEDGIGEKIATFAEGNEPVHNLIEAARSVESAHSASADPSPTFASLMAGANVFILFDTSNYMYRGFVFAQDAIVEFVRSLGTVNKIAFYSYCRDLSRASTLTADRSQLLHAVRSTVAGDDAALYNTLLLTLRDATQYSGRKVVVVFSNGPDNSSVVPPEDVAEFAQSAGISVYMISTQEARLEPVSTAVFDRMTAATGGKAYFAKNWRGEKQAFASVRDDLEHLYSISYYPKPNANDGWRSISVKLVGNRIKKYHVRTRNGYRPRPTRFSTGDSTKTLSRSFPEK